MNIVGKQIGQLRTKQGLTQEQLAAKCQVLGLDISRSTLAKVESLGRQVTDVELKIFAQALNVSSDTLLELEL